jgi:hypothetical protein
MRIRSVLRAAALLAATGFLSAGRLGECGSSPRFEIVVPSSVEPEPITGRVYVMISRNNEKEPRFQIGRTGVPFFGRDVVRLAPGEPARSSTLTARVTTTGASRAPRPLAPAKWPSTFCGRNRRA